MNEKQLLNSIVDSLQIMGYYPIDQLYAYVKSHNPRFITSANNARALISMVSDETICSYIANCR